MNCPEPLTRVGDPDRACIAAISRVLERAFANDPLICHLLGSRADSAETRRRYMEICLAGTYSRRGEIMTAGGGHAVACWLGPDADPPDVEDLTEVVEMLEPGDADVVLRTAEALRSMHPVEPHWYLGIIGTDPAEQGRGWGTALLKHEAVTFGATPLPTYLETATEGNVAFYRRRGFALLPPLQLLRGPVVHRLWRRPDRSTRASR